MRKPIIIIIIVVLLAAAGFLIIRQRSGGQDQEVEVLREAPVEVGKITATVNATGSIEPESLVTLSFGQGGIIRELNVVRGQSVSAEDVLATLDTDELALAVKQAEDGLRIQELALQQALNSEPSQATLLAGQADIDAANGNLLVARANLLAAEAALDQTEAQKAQILAGPTSGQVATAESQVTSARSQQQLAEETHDRTMTCVEVTLPTGEKEEICPALGPAEEQARSNLESANAMLAAAEAQLADLFSAARPANIQAADGVIAAAEAQIAGAEGNIIVAEANGSRADAAYDRLFDGPTADDLAILEAQIESTKTTLELAKLRLRRAMLIAPITGRVATLLISEGEQVGPGSPAINVVNEDAFHIEVSVDEIDIDQIVTNQQVDITLDALPETVVSGIISEISPIAATSGVGVVTYLVTINIDAEDIPLRPGMTANASIVVDEKDNVHIVPNWAIRLNRETGRAFVNRLAGDRTIEEVTVDIGLRNEQFSEVVSGLNEGDVVVVTNERAGLGSFFGG
jgi:HlyD family secretion protein